MLIPAKGQLYLNLTNGLDVLPLLTHQYYKVIRIQSTACEQKRWDFILSDLDHNLLFDLAIGQVCYIVDCSHTGKMTRALYQGLEWIRYALTRYWLDKPYKPLVKGMNVEKYFSKMYEEKVSKQTFNKLKYYKKFLLTEEIRLVPISWETEHDGDYEYFKKIVEQYK